jgi:hypothetical protein
VALLSVSRSMPINQKFAMPLKTPTYFHTLTA